MVNRRQFMQSSLALVVVPAAAADPPPAPSPAKLVLLGTKGGPTLRGPAQLPSSNVLLVGGDAYVVDAGYGVTLRLAQAKVPLRSIRSVYITHHHSDHNLELGALLYNAWVDSATHPIEVYGPEGIEPLLANWFDANRFDIETRMADEGRSDPRALVHAHRYRAGLVSETAAVRVTALRNEHPPISESYALRFDFRGGKSVVFSGDTAFFPPLAEFAKDCDYLVHEAMYGPAMDRLVRLNPAAKTLNEHLHAAHTLTTDVGRIAAKANARNLVLTHFVPSGDASVKPEDWLSGVRENYHGNVILARDLLEVPLE